MADAVAPPEGTTPPTFDFTTMDRETLGQICTGAEAVFRSMLDDMWVPCCPTTTKRTVEITGINGNVVPVDIHEPSNKSADAPCIVYFHGGGMTFFGTQEYSGPLSQLAKAGCVVVAPDFRNSPVAPFPGGVHDCLAAALWAKENKAALGTDKLIWAGESGGGCLALSVPLVATRRGLVVKDLTDGVWVDAPMTYQHPMETPLPSHTENSGYVFVSEGPMSTLTLCTRTYSEDPKAYPINATAEELLAFPRTNFTLWEKDPLRDEGLDMFRKFIAAGHPEVKCSMEMGMAHCSMLLKMQNPSYCDRYFKRMVSWAKEACS
eukprot:TRINITY_DN62392_c0_g1_i1.p2 TRINITY_DN62392_c0_g1~~TRINITY_DN62392_c0_g1_i1.p2  ORF type:complete len:364 (+),score=46.54 TRINITY_DN62392_c0_g1_i1:135-1094(+)